MYYLCTNCKAILTDIRILNCDKKYGSLNKYYFYPDLFGNQEKVIDWRACYLKCSTSYDHIHLLQKFTLKDVEMVRLLYEK